MIIKHFKADGTFGAVSKAEKYCKKKGYSVGSMQRDAYRALAKGDISMAKWHNIEESEYPRIDGLMVSHDFREGSATVILFEGDERFDSKVDYKAHIKCA